jgi:hypothetical protein
MIINYRTSRNIQRNCSFQGCRILFLSEYRNSMRANNPKIARYSVEYSEILALRCVTISETSSSANKRLSAVHHSRNMLGRLITPLPSPPPSPPPPPPTGGRACPFLVHKSTYLEQKQLLQNYGIHS